MAIKPVRARTLRRAQQRKAAREVRDVRRDLAKRGIYDRCNAINAVVAPGNRAFWRIYRERVAAREMIVPITKVVEARDIAVKALEEIGVDLTDVTLRADWQPPRMVFDAVPSYEVAMDAVAVRAAKLKKITKTEARR